MKQKLAIVTGNPLKFRELSAALEPFFKCEQKILKNYFEIQGKPEEILRQKLLAAYNEFQQPVLADDTSVYISELNGFPGPYIKDFWECFSPYEMGLKFAGSRIKIVSQIGLMFDADTIIFASGTIEGDIITPKTRDDNGTEFDLFVRPDGSDKPMIEMTVEEKNKISHRGLAIQDLLKKLKDL